MYALKKISGFLRLYRPDVFLRFALLYLLGSFLAAGFASNPLYNCLIALLISGISINFVYSLNSWFDADIDKINKPYRPIPSGLISRPQALTYAFLLLLLSLVYPFVLFGFSATAAWFLFFPVAGILYSNPLFSFKKRKLLALLLITSAILLTCSLGYFLNGGMLTSAFYIDAFEVVVICAALIPLKDISDVKGDTAGGADNWFAGRGRQRVFFYSGGLLVSSALVALFLESSFVKTVILSTDLYFLGLFALFPFFRTRPYIFRVAGRLFVILITLALLGTWLFLYAKSFI